MKRDLHIERIMKYCFLALIALAYYGNTAMFGKTALSALDCQYKAGDLLAEGIRSQNQELIDIATGKSKTCNQISEATLAIYGLESK